MNEYQIGQLAKKVRVKTDTIRFYEKIGLLPKPFQTQSGYRQYVPEDLKRLRFIIRAKEIGFTLAEIKGLLAIKVSSTNTCEAVYEQSQNKINLIDQKIRDLEKIKMALDKLMKHCHLENQQQKECPILEALETEGERL